MTYDNSALVVQTYLSRPPYRAIWLRMRSTIAAEFRSEIDKIFAELPIAAPREVSAQFQSDLQRVMAQTSSEVHAPVLSG